MPAVRKVVGPRGSEFWGSFDRNDHRLVAETLKEEFQRSESVHNIHHMQSGPDHIPAEIENVRVSFHCLRDCLIFLLRGAIFIDGQGALIEPGFAYVVKDEECVGLGGNTTIFVMEEGQMKGICVQKMKEFQEKYFADKKAEKKKEQRLWNWWSSKFGQRVISQLQ